MLTLLLIRHGAYDVTDGRLTPAGRAQAAAVGRALPDVAAVYSSPAVLTAETAAALGHPVTVDDRWAEADFPTSHWLAVDGDGQTWAAVQARVSAGLRDLIARHPAGTVAVVTHADVVRAAVGLCLGAPTEHLLRIAVDHASVTTVEVDAGGPVVRGVNRRPFDGEVGSVTA